MMHIADVHLSVTPKRGGVAASEPLTHHSAGRAASYKMHPQITMLRYDAVTVAQHRCRSDGCRLVSLRRVDTTDDTPL